MTIITALRDLSAFARVRSYWARLSHWQKAQQFFSFSRSAFFFHVSRVHEGKAAARSKITITLATTSVNSGYIGFSISTSNLPASVKHFTRFDIVTGARTPEI